jgi:flagellar M-ring protein FliF
MNYLLHSWQWFQIQNKTKQISLLAGAISILVITTLFLNWIFLPKYGVLFTNLDIYDASQITARLEEAKIEYKISNQGRDILINNTILEKTRLQLMGQDIPLKGSFGFELFDKNDLGITDFTQKINYQRALQGELERTISSLKEVKRARIHLVIPEHHLFQDNDNLPSASVTLHLKQSLSSQQIASIQQLIKHSIAKMQTKKVIIVDQNGNNLTLNTKAQDQQQFSTKITLENYLNQKVSQMLVSIFPNQRIFVKIDARINYDRLQRELIKPKDYGLLSHEKETQHAITNKKGKSKKQDMAKEKTYHFGSEKEQFTRASGTIERLTISVAIPENVTNENIAQIERLVKMAVGFDSQRGDNISVEAIIKTEQHKIKKPIPEIYKLRGTKILPGLMIPVLIAAVFFQILMRKRRRLHLLKTLQQSLVKYE